MRDQTGELPDWLTPGGKRYFSADAAYRRQFGRKAVKLPLDAGFTCPNRDGRKGAGGCAYCSGAGSGDFAESALLPLDVQYRRQRERLAGKWPGAAPIAYFQAFTNTYGPVERIQAMLEEAAALPEIAGIALATRADCIDGEIAGRIADIARRLPVEVELGLQTAHDETAGRINRCHSFAEFKEGYRLLAGRGIPVCVHLINGLPGETKEMMLETVRAVSRLRPHGVKIHMLHLLRGTALGAAYEARPFPLLSMEEYIDVVCDQLELLPPETVIERLTGDGKRSGLIAPGWTLRKKSVLNGIDRELRRRDSWQSKRFSEEGAG